MRPLGSHQTITVPANSSNDYKMQNEEWSVKVSIDKIDSETKQRIKGDAEFKIFAWDTVRQCYIPFGGYNRYKVERQADGTYKVINHSDYAVGSDDLFYTQRSEGKFVNLPFERGEILFSKGFFYLYGYSQSAFATQFYTE